MANLVFLGRESYISVFGRQDYPFYVVNRNFPYPEATNQYIDHFPLGNTPQESILGLFFLNK